MATSEALPSARPVVSAQQILNARHVVNTLYVDDKIRDYIVDLVLATRPPVSQDPGPRRLYPNRRLAARHHQPDPRRARHGLPQRPPLRHPAGRQEHRLDVLRHRVSVTYEAEAENITSEDVIHKILDALPVP